MVTVGTVLGVVAVIAVIVLLYKWPDIVGHIGHTHNEYFENTPPAAPAATAPQEPAVEKLPIEGMSPTSLIQALAVPQIKSLEGFQSGTVPLNYDDGNGNADNNKNWNGGVGNGYGSGRANIAFSWSTGVGAGSAAGAGPILTSTPAPVIANTSINKPRQVITTPQIIKKPAFSTKGKPVLRTGPIPIGDVEVGSYARENDTSTPSFSITSSLVDQHALNTLKTNLASGGEYTVNVTSDLPNVKYSFPLMYIDDMVNSKKSYTYAFTLANSKFAKMGPQFAGASTLDFEIVETAPLPKTAPNAPPPPTPKPQPTPLPVIMNTSFTVASCKTLGYPSVDNKSRLFSQQECNKLTGNWSADGTCTYNNDRSWSKLCSVMNPPNPVATSNAMVALRTPMLSIGDVGTGPYITELQTPYPAFIVNATIIDPNVIDTLKTNLASSAKYKVNVVSDIPGTNYTFDLGQITDAINPVSGDTFAYTFMNSSVDKQSPFRRSKKLALSIIMIGGLPSNAPNAQLNTQHDPTPPNPISSIPPSTMESIIPKNVPVSSASKYQFSNQSSMMDGKALAEKIRSVEGMLRCK